MKKRFLALTMAALMTATALTGCGGSAEEPLDKLTFTYVTAPLNVPSIVEKEKGIFAKAFEELLISVK